MRKLVLILAFVMFLNNVSVQAHSAKSSILIDGINGRVLWENNAYERLGMASTTKIMTAIVALENSNLTDIVTASANAAGTEGSSIYLQVGEQATMENLLYALMLHSGNDAATAIAEHISGSTEAFAVLMNESLEKMGVSNTNFTNPHGLHDENHYTTAFDLAQITRYAMQNPTFAQIVGTVKKTIPRAGYEWGRALTNHNKLLRQYDGATGVKTGFTKDTGRTLVSSAMRDGLPLIVVTLNAPDDWNDHTGLLDYGFANFDVHNLMNEGLYVRTLTEDRAGLLGDNYIGVVVGEDLKVVLRDGELDIVEFEYDIPDAAPRNLSDGDKIGEVRALVNGKVVGESILVVRRNGKDGEARRRDSFTEIYGQLWRGLTTLR